MKKKLIRLTEGDLHRIIKESVKKVLKEERTIDAKTIYNDILNNIDELFDNGEMEIILGEYIGESFNVYLINENTIQVEYYNKKVNVPLQKSISECSNNLIARYVMNGFARLYNQ